MASAARLRALIDELLARQEPAIRKAFLEAMQDARDAIVLQDVVDALARGDLAAAMQAIEFSRAFLAPLDQEIARSYFESGRAFTALLLADVRRGGLTVEVRFDPGSPRAAAWVRQHSSQLIVEIVEDQRAAVREALGVGLDAGRNPRSVALDVVGRIDQVTKRRAGGIVGLHSGQARAVENARAELLSGDPARMQAYFDRKLRDRRFDRVVRQAIKEGRPVSAVDVRRLTTRYSDRLLKHRGDMIARTESLTALSYAQDEATEQMLQASGLRRDQIKKTWRSRADGRTRETHTAMNGQVRALDEPFASPSGARLRFPRDGMAPSSETIQCRCYLTTAVQW